MPDELPAAVSANIDASNRGDLDGFLASFTKDGAVDDWGRTFTGAAAIKGWSDNEFIGKDVSLRVTSVQQRGDEVVVIAEVGGKGFNGPTTFTYTLEGALVSLMKLTA